MNSIKETTLTAAMGLSWKLMNIGDSALDAGERVGANGLGAGFAEMFLWRTGRAFIIVGEWLELGTNRVAMWLDYEDGELSEIVAGAWNAPPH